MALRLHVAAHHAKAHHRRPIAREEGRDDGVEGPLARGHQVGNIGRGRIGRETMTAVLQADAKLGLDHTRAKAHVVALDEAHHHALLVGGGQVDRAAAHRVARRKGLRTTRIDQARTAGQVVGIEHLRRGQLHGARLGHIAVDIGKGQLHGLDLQVVIAHAVEGLPGQIGVLQNAQGDLRGNALAVGWDLVQGVARKVLPQGRDPLGLVTGQVLGLQGAAQRLRKAHQGLGDLALIQVAAPAVGNAAQGARCGRKAEQLAHLGRTAPGQERGGKARQCAQLGRGRGPLLLHHHRHQVAALGDLDGRLHQVGKGQAAKALGQGAPGRHRPRHGDRVDAPLGWVGAVGAVFALEVFGGPATGGRSAGVQAMELLAVPQNAEGIRAQAVAHRLDQGHDGRGGNGRIHRIAPGLQDAQAGLRGQGMRGGHHIAGKDRQAGAGVGVVRVERMHISPA